MAEGGFIVTLLAASRPERVSSLILINATPGITAEPFRNWGMAARTLDDLHDRVEGDWGQVGFGIPKFAPSAVGDTRYEEWLRRAARRSL